MKLLLYPPVDSVRLEKTVAAASPMTVVNAQDESAAFQQIPDADAMFGKITPSLLAKASSLRWIQSPTASLEHYIFPELATHPVTLTNMRGLFSDVIADQVFGYVLCFGRNLHHYIRQQMSALWAPIGGEGQRAVFTSGPAQVTNIDQATLHLSDQTLGVIGLGGIGSETALRGRAFGMRVIGLDPRSDIEVEAVETVFPVDQLPQFLAESDFVVIAAPHTPHTEKMFRREQFQQMKRTAFLINIGRGAIVDLADLTAALEAGEIAGAGLDVFEVEPLPKESPLWKMTNVIITPHVAGYSPRIAQRHLEVLLENVRRFVSGKELLNVVNKELWY